jgi:hypothetical protein
MGHPAKRHSAEGLGRMNRHGYRRANSIHPLHRREIFPCPRSRRTKWLPPIARQASFPIDQHHKQPASSRRPRQSHAGWRPVANVAIRCSLLTMAAWVPPRQALRRDRHSRPDVRRKDSQYGHPSRHLGWRYRRQGRFATTRCSGTRPPPAQVPQECDANFPLAHRFRRTRFRQACDRFARDRRPAHSARRLGKSAGYAKAVRGLEEFQKTAAGYSPPERQCDTPRAPSLRNKPLLRLPSTMRPPAARHRRTLGIGLTASTIRQRRHAGTAD